MSEGGWTLTAMTETRPTPLTAEQFGGIQTKHGRIIEFDTGDWWAYGHLSENQFFEAYNEANRILETGVRMTEAPRGIVQRWATVVQVDPAVDDEWEMRAPATNTSQTPGAFPVTLDLRDAGDSCSHCPDGHGAPSRTAWGVRLDTVTRDGDGQPTRMIVESTTLAHVAQADVDWLHGLITNRERVLHHSMVLNSIGWAMTKALGDVPPFVSSDDLREVCDRLIARMKDAEAALLALIPYQQPDEALDSNTEYLSIPVDDITYQWGCATNSDLPITPASEATARDMAGRYGNGVVRRPVGPWEEAPPAEPTPVLPVIALLAYCSLAKVPVSSKVTVPSGQPVPPIGALLTLPCSWDSRHQHEYQVVPTPVSALQAYELVMADPPACAGEVRDA